MRRGSLAGLALAIGSLPFAGTDASAGEWWRDCDRGEYGYGYGYAPARAYGYYGPPVAYYAPPPAVYSYYGPSAPIRYYAAPPSYGYVVRPQLFDAYYGDYGRYRGHTRWRRW